MALISNKLFFADNDERMFIGTNSYNSTSVPSYVGIITHPSIAAEDYFGLSVAVGYGKIVVGAFADDIGIGLTDAGSAHIYDLNRNYIGIITHPSAAAYDYFGNSVAVGSGRIVIGAYTDDVNGLTNAGSAHIYDLNGNYIGIITHPSAAANDSFGRSVAAGSGRIVVGSSSDDVNGIVYAGSAHIYDLNGSYVGILTHPNAASYDYFGRSVSVGSGRIVVGAPDAGVDGIGNAGSAHIYDLNGNYVGILTHPSASVNDSFGVSVAVGSGRIVVGARYDTVSGITNAGSAHIYDLSGNYITQITHPSASGSDNFGQSVAVGSGRIVVGAYNDDVNGVANVGSALIYDLNGNYVGIITNIRSSEGDNFGQSVAVGSGRIVVGAASTDANGLYDSGAAFVYSTPDHQHILDIL